MHTATAQLIEHKLGRSLALYIRARRVEELSWRAIAQQITHDTGVPVSYESLRTWFSAVGREEAPSLRDTA